MGIYQINNLKKQVSNCVLNDFVPDPVLCGQLALTMWEIYQMNNLKKQVSHCVLNDFVPNPILWGEIALTMWRYIK